MRNGHEVGGKRKERGGLKTTSAKCSKEEEGSSHIRRHRPGPCGFSHMEDTGDFGKSNVGGVAGSSCAWREQKREREKSVRQRALGPSL